MAASMTSVRDTYRYCYSEQMTLETRKVTEHKSSKRSLAGLLKAQLDVQHAVPS